MGKTAISLTFLLLSLSILFGAAYAGYYFNHNNPYYNNYRNSYYGSVFPYHYNDYGFHANERLLIINNYNNYYFDNHYDRALSYKTAYSHDMGCDDYYIGHRCNIAYYPDISYSIY